MHLYIIGRRQERALDKTRVTASHTENKREKLYIALPLYHKHIYTCIYVVHVYARRVGVHEKFMYLAEDVQCRHPTSLGEKATQENER